MMLVWSDVAETTPLLWKHNECNLARLWFVSNGDHYRLNIADFLLRCVPDCQYGYDVSEWLPGTLGQYKYCMKFGVVVDWTRYNWVACKSNMYFVAFVLTMLDWIEKNMESDLIVFE